VSGGASGAKGAAGKTADKAAGLIVCRCEEVTSAEIEAAIADGALTANEVKRMTRAGMGLCQGRTCGRLVRQIIARRTGVPVGEVAVPTVRPPVRPIPLGRLAAAADDGAGGGAGGGSGGGAGGGAGAGGGL